MSPEHFDRRSLTLLEKRENLKGKNSQNSVGKLFPSFTTHIALLPRSAGIKQSEVIQNPFQQREVTGETPSCSKGKGSDYLQVSHCFRRHFRDSQLLHFLWKPWNADVIANGLVNPCASGNVMLGLASPSGLQEHNCVVRNCSEFPPCSKYDVSCQSYPKLAEVKKMRAGDGCFGRIPEPCHDLSSFRLLKGRSLFCFLLSIHSCDNRFL